MENVNIPEMPHHFFTNKLIEWSLTHERPLPWKGEKDPYLIWLSEIILQQTQVEQGRPYFEKFKTAYPSVYDLAKADEDEIMKRWQGLGYYSRARNLHSTAKHVAKALNGVFPDSFEGLKKLKGVGTYTAAAIASFAYGLPVAVVDGNVFRVLTRFFGITDPVDTAKGKKAVGLLADKMLDTSDPARYNQAIMDFGAGHCKSRRPLCARCPLSEQCVAFRQKRVEAYPVKVKRIKKKTRYFNYLIIQFENSVYLQKRQEKDIWRDLYQFPLIETERIPEIDEVEKKIAGWELFDLAKPLIKSSSGPFSQMLTHQKIVGMFFKIQVERPLKTNERSLFKVESEKVNKFAVPKLIDWFLADKSLSLF